MNDFYRNVQFEACVGIKSKVNNLNFHSDEESKKWLQNTALERKVIECDRYKSATRCAGQTINDNKIIT